MGFIAVAFLGSTVSLLAAAFWEAVRHVIGQHRA